MRRTPVKGDIAVIDYPSLNAICIVSDMTHEPSASNGIASDSNPAYLFDFICGVQLVGGSVSPAVGSIWLNDDQEHISIVGENGYKLPREFYGLDVVEMFRQLGATIE